MPADHGGERLDHDHPLDAGVGEGSRGGVPESQPTHEHVDAVGGAPGQPETGEFDLSGGEQARHQELLAQLHLVDIDAQGRLISCEGTEMGVGRRRMVRTDMKTGLQMDASPQPRRGTSIGRSSGSSPVSTTATPMRASTACRGARPDAGPCI